MIKPFKNVFWDIVSYCNAKCPFCQSGVNPAKERVEISPQNFRRILENLFEGNGINNETLIGLYNWSEPFLHKELNQITSILEQLGLSFSFSTNASILPKIDPSFCKKLNSLTFSMPGFSQHSYDRVHGFSFEKISRNIQIITRSIRQFNPNVNFKISFHVYQFNVGEITNAWEFADKHKIEFSQVYAILNDWERVKKFKKGVLLPDKLDSIYSCLFSFHWQKKWIPEKAGFDCPQYQYLVIDEQGNLLPCCQVPKGIPSFTFGNLAREHFSDIIEKQRSLPVCIECSQSGMARFWNSALVVPDFIPHLSSSPRKLFSRLVSAVVRKIRSKKPW